MTTNQIKGLSRNPIDKFYTDILYANKCVNYIKKYVEIAKDDLIIEPSAGNGSFMECIKSLNTDCKFYDIEPENEEIIKQDYLLLDTSNFEKKVHIRHIHHIRFKSVTFGAS